MAFSDLKERHYQRRIGKLLETFPELREAWEDPLLDGERDGAVAFSFDWVWEPVILALTVPVVVVIFHIFQSLWLITAIFIAIFAVFIAFIRIKGAFDEKYKFTGRRITHLDRLDDLILGEREDLQLLPAEAERMSGLISLHAAFRGRGETIKTFEPVSFAVIIFPIIFMSGNQGSFDILTLLKISVVIFIVLFLAGLRTMFAFDVYGTVSATREIYGWARTLEKTSSKRNEDKRKTINQTSESYNAAGALSDFLLIFPLGILMGSILMPPGNVQITITLFSGGFALLIAILWLGTAAARQNAREHWLDARKRFVEAYKEYHGIQGESQQ